METRTPIIPFGFVGGGDAVPTIANLYRLGKLFGVPYRITNRVVEFDEDRRIAWRYSGAHRWRYELEPTDEGGTHVTETWDASRYHPLAFRALALTGFPERNRQGITETLVRLKQEAEARA